jgi:hypothetical protein
MLTAAEVALIVSGAALIGTAATIHQKSRTDRHEVWWGRTQWALEQVLANQGRNDKNRTVGLLMLKALQASSLANSEERKMLEQVAEACLPSPPEHKTRHRD